MSNVGQISVTLDLNSNQFTVGVQRAGQQIKQINGQLNQMGAGVRQAQSHLNGLGGSVRAAAVNLGIFRAAMASAFTLGGGAVLLNIVNINTELERMRVLLQGMNKELGPAGAVAKANEEFEYLVDMARQAPFELAALTNAFVKLKSAGIDPMAGSMQSLVDAVAAMGGDSNSLQRASIAIQQMAGKGVISMEELRQQLGEAVPRAMELMARSMGITVGELSKMVATGTVVAEDALKRMMSEFAIAFGGDAAKRMDTFEGALNRLKTEWKLLAEEFGKSGFMDQLKQSVQELTTAMSDPRTKQGVQELGQTFGYLVSLIRDAVKNLWEWRDTLKSIFAGLIAFGAARAVLGGIAAAIVAIRTEIVSAGVAASVMGTRITAATVAARGLALASAAMGGPVGIAAAAIGFLTFKLWESKEASEAAERAFVGFQESMKRGEIASEEEVAAVQGRVDQMAEAMERVREAATSMYERRGLATNGGTIREIYESMKGEVSDQEWAALVMGRYNVILRAMQEGEAQLKGQLAKNSARIVARAAGEEFDRTFNELANSYGDAQRRLDNAFQDIQDKLEAGGFGSDKDEAGKTARAKRMELVSKEIGAIQIAINEAEIGLRGNLKTLQTQLDAASGDPEDRRARIQMVEDQIERLRELRNRVRRDAAGLTADPVKQNESMGGAGTPTARQTEGADYIRRLTGDIENLKAELQGANGPLAEFNTLVDLGRFSDLDATQLESVRQLIPVLEELKNQRKEQNEALSVGNDLTQLQAKLDADLISAQDRLSGDVYSNVSAGMVGLNRQIAEMATKLQITNPELTSLISRTDVSADEFGRLAAESGITGEKLAEFVNAMRGAIATQSQLDLSNFILEMRELRQEASMVGLNESQREEMEHQRRLQRIREWTGTFVAGSAERATAELEASQTIAAMERARQFERMGQFGQMLQSWTDDTANWQGFWTNSLSGAADTLTTFLTGGKADWSAFAESIIKDIMKMMIQAALARLVMSFMPGFGVGMSVGSGLGQGSLFGNMSGSMPISVANPFGGFTGKSAIGAPPLFASSALAEAYVPTPGKAAGDAGMKAMASSPSAPPIQVNVINQSGQPVNAEQQGGPKFDGQQYVLDVVLQAAQRPGGFRDGIRSAMK